MCLIVFAWRVRAGTPLLLAANRDEFHQRPTAAAAFWDDAPGVLAGRDLEAGGTWLGISRSGRFAAITNVRDPRAGDRPATRSRGELTTEFLSTDVAPRAYLEDVARRAAAYQGFNLLVGDGQTLFYLHGDGDPAARPQQLEPGIYGLSNAALDVPWPKVVLARTRLRDLLATGGPVPGHDELRACLASRELAAEADLHGHGLSGEMARRLSAQFIVTDPYGTRCTTTLSWQDDGRRSFAEQRFDVRGELTGSDEFQLA